MLTDIVMENLSYLSTEQGHPLTSNLSRVLCADCVEGLRLLHEVDRKMLRGFRFFIEQYLPKLSQLLKQSPGRRVLAGSGSERIDSKADSNDGFEVVKLNVSSDFASALFLNYSEIPNCCRF